MIIFVNDFLFQQKSVNFQMGQVFTIEPSKICGRQPLKNLKGYGLLPKLSGWSASQIQYNNEYYNVFTLLLVLAKYRK